LEYSSRHGQARALVGLLWITKMRRRIGIEPEPFTPIPKRKRRCVRYYRVAAKIVAKEAELLARLGRQRRPRRGMRMRKVVR
jgi:hypothetical protein